MDIGLLLVRIAVGLLVAGHGAQKLFGSFGGYGIAGTGGFFESLGYRPGKPLAVLAGLGEFVGGLLLLFGWFTPFGAAAVIGVMANAVASAHWGKGPWATSGGWELPVTNAAVAAMLAFTGTGEVSLDAALDWDLAGTDWGAVALLLGLGSALVVLGLRAASRGRAAVGGAPAIGHEVRQETGDFERV
jgi:putative oxidoreductase